MRVHRVRGEGILYEVTGISKALVFSVPPIAFSLLFAAFALKMRIVLNGYVFLVILLGGYCLVGLGALVAFYSKTGRVASVATQYLSPIITFLAPVFIPKELGAWTIGSLALVFPRLDWRERRT